MCQNMNLLLPTYLVLSIYVKDSLFSLIPEKPQLLPPQISYPPLSSPATLSRNVLETHCSLCLLLLDASLSVPLRGRTPNTIF